MCPISRVTVDYCIRDDSILYAPPLLHIFSCPSVLRVKAYKQLTMHYCTCSKPNSSFWVFSFLNGIICTWNSKLSPDIKAKMSPTVPWAPEPPRPHARRGIPIAGVFVVCQSICGAFLLWPSEETRITISESKHCHLSGKTSLNPPSSAPSFLAPAAPLPPWARLPRHGRGSVHRTAQPHQLRNPSE